MSKKVYTNIITWIIRILVGGTFAYSGFVKGIDPYGTLYKFEDYFNAMGVSVIPTLTIMAVFVLCLTEFSIGVFIILGCFRRIAPRIAGAVMCIMLPLSLWVYIANPVSDCGCFGDAIIISNSLTFWKNVVLAIVIVWLIKYQQKTICLIRPFLQWVAFVMTNLYIFSIALIGFHYQPLIDFRPYPVGDTIIDNDIDNSQQPEYLFIYAKGTELKEFKETDVLPNEEDGWEFVDRKEIDKKKPITKTKLKNLQVWDRTGETNLTDSIFSDNSKNIVLFIPDIERISIARTWQINSLYSMAERLGINMFAIVSATPEAISTWEDLSIPEYPIYTAEDTIIKEVVRGNPAVVYIEDNIIKWKSTLVALDTDDFLSSEITDINTFGRNNHRILFNLTYIYILVIFILILISTLTAFKRFHIKLNSNTYMDKE
jgi:uncharacterized membrane protein YphA (DoxX/SURF4 family)